MSDEPGDPGDPADLGPGDAAALLRWRLAIGPSAEKVSPTLSLDTATQAESQGAVGLEPGELGGLDDGRRLGLLALREFVSGQLTGLNVPLFDLEDDVAAFNAPLPRVRIIPLAEFDPEYFLR